jgi:hypothetical protein
MVLELNVVDEFLKVEQEIRCHVLLVGWWVILERVVGVDATNGPACKYGYLG